MLAFFVFLQIFVITIIMHTLLTLIKGDSTHMQKMIIYFLTTALIQNFGYMLELTSKSLESAMTAVKVEYLGCSFLPLCFMVFMYHYCKRDVNNLLNRILLSIDCIVLALVWTSPLHPFYYNKITFTDTGYFPHLELSYGNGFSLYFIGSVMIPFVLSVRVLVSSYLMEKRPNKQKNLYRVLLLTSITELVFIFHVIGLFPIPGYDPIPFVTGFIMTLLAKTVWNPNDYDLIRIAGNSVFNSLSDCALMLDEYREILSYNDAAVRLFPSLTVKKKIEDVDQFPLGLLEFEGRSKFSIHSKHYEGHVKILKDTDAELRGYAILIVDTTETDEYVKELLLMRENAERANHAKSDFLSNISNEIRTPINSIVGLSELIIEESTRRKVYDFACNIKSASMNLLSLINNILDLSNLETGKIKLTENNYYLKLFAEETVELVHLAAMKKGLQMNFLIDDSLPHCLCGDEVRIRQILINLLDNAIKFTNKGSILFTTKGELLNDYELSLVFTVKDTGPGIPQDKLANIFDAFEQVNLRKSFHSNGIGLGLAIARHLAIIMGGDIQVTSTYGKGACFTVSIIQKVTDKRSIKEMPTTRQSLQTNSIQKFQCPNYHVLVVEANKINCDLICEMLLQYDMSVDRTDSGQKAIWLAKEHKYDMIFINHIMSEMDGIETAHHILAEYKDTKDVPTLIALSANTIDSAKEIYTNNGFTDFLTKPFEQEQLYTLLYQQIPEDKKIYPQQDKNEPKDKTPAIHTDSDKDKKFLEKDNHETPKTPGLEHELYKYFMRDVDVVSSVDNQGGLENYLELLDLFYTNGEKKIKLFQQLIEKRDIINYVVEVHGLKSAAANIGADKLSQLARMHEESGKTSDFNYILNNKDELIDNYRALLTEIRRVLNLQNQDNQTVGETALKTIGTSEMTERIEHALHLLETFKSKEAASETEELLSFKLPENVRSKLEEIQTLLKMYEDDQAEDIFRDLLSSLTVN